MGIRPGAFDDGVIGADVAHGDSFVTGCNNEQKAEAVMTVAQLRKELVETGADPFEVAALALERVERLESELREVRSKGQVVFTERRVVDFQGYRKGRRYCGCGA